MEMFIKLRDYYQTALEEQNKKLMKNTRQEYNENEELDITNDAAPAVDKVPEYDVWIQQLLQRLPESEISFRLDAFAAAKYVKI